MDNRRQRKNRIRFRVAAGTVSVFLALFGGIYAQVSASDDSVAATTASVSSASSSRSDTTVAAMTTRQS
jgi:hypothetical protein